MSKGELLIDDFLRGDADDVVSAFHFGPLHIVVEDFNFDDSSVEFCRNAVWELLQKPDTILRHGAFEDGFSLGRAVATLGTMLILLEYLEAIPEEER